MTFNEYPVMGAVALAAGLALVLLLNMLGGGPASESPLKRAAPAGAFEVVQSPSVQAEIARERRAVRHARQRASARRRARDRETAAAAAPVVAPRTGSNQEYRSQPYLGPGTETAEQQPAAPSPRPRPDPAPRPESDGSTRGGSFDDSG